MLEGFSAIPSFFERVKRLQECWQAKNIGESKDNKMKRLVKVKGLRDYQQFF